MEESITPGQNGLPSRKLKSSSYTSEEKALIVAEAAKSGTRVVADAYGIDWHNIASWKRFYGKENGFEAMSKNKKNKAKTMGAAKSKSTSNSTAKVNVSVAPVMSVMELIIQSPSGQEITPEDVRAKISTAVGSVDRVYIRPDEGKAYWVHGEEHGAVELW
mgnify:CR=1 FL=1